MKHHPRDVGVAKFHVSSDIASACIGNICSLPPSPLLLLHLDIPIMCDKHLEICKVCCSLLLFITVFSNLFRIGLLRIFFPICFIHHIPWNHFILASFDLGKKIWKSFWRCVSGIELGGWVSIESIFSPSVVITGRRSKVRWATATSTTEACSFVWIWKVIYSLLFLLTPCFGPMQHSPFHKILYGLYLTAIERYLRPWSLCNIAHTHYQKSPLVWGWFCFVLFLFFIFSVRDARNIS